MEEHTIQLLANYDLDIVELDISEKEIEGILCLKEFVELKKLNCECNKIKSLYNLPSSSTTLYCGFNQIKSLKNHFSV